MRSTAGNRGAALTMRCRPTTILTFLFNLLNTHQRLRAPLLNYGSGAVECNKSPGETLVLFWGAAILAEYVRKDLIPTIRQPPWICTCMWPWWTVVQNTLTCQSVPPALDRRWYGTFHYRSVHGWNLCISETRQQWPPRPLGYVTGQSGILCDAVALAGTLYRAPLKWKEKRGKH